MFGLLASWHRVAYESPYAVDIAVAVETMLVAACVIVTVAVPVKAMALEAKYEWEIIIMLGNFLFSDQPFTMFQSEERVTRVRVFGTCKLIMLTIHVFLVQYAPERNMLCSL
jgi:hypothetical protein